MVTEIQNFCIIYPIQKKRHLILVVSRLCQAIQSKLTTIVFIFITALLGKSYCFMVYSIETFGVLIAGKKKGK